MIGRLYTLHLGFGLFSGAFAVSFQGVYQHLPNVANSTLRNMLISLLDLLEGPGDTGDITPPKTNMVHLKMGAPWKFGDSYWKPSFPGSMLIFGGVDHKKLYVQASSK